MNQIDKNMSHVDSPVFKDVGFRFLLFQKAIGVKDEQLALDLQVSVEKLWKFISGEIAPKILQLHLLHEKYRLNMHWLITGDGLMFSGQPVKNKGDSENNEGLEEKKERDRRLEELVHLMQMPLVEQAIDAALTQILALLKLENFDKTKK